MTETSEPLVQSSGALKRARQNKRRSNTGKLIHEHYLEIEYLLERVEKALTHYQTLGVERSAKNDEVVEAYHRAIAVLHPSYYKVRASVPDEMLTRIDHAFNKVSEAFVALTNNQKRAEYDRTIQRRTPVPLPLEIPRAGKKVAPAQEARPKEVPATGGSLPGGDDTVNIHVAVERPVLVKEAPRAPEANRRRCDRFKLSVPALVAGYGQTSKWNEVTRTIDVSRMGVAVQMQRRVKPGTVLHITLPLPTRLRNHGFSEPGYNMYAIVRRVEPAKEGVRVVGLEFIGQNPPAGFLHKPWATFRTQKWDACDRRREPRFELAEKVAVEYLDENGRNISREVTVTENMSAGGARIVIKSPPPEYEMVRVTIPAKEFQSAALVRNLYSGQDGFERICVQFIERRWPV
jgi:hypothetical protein